MELLRDRFEALLPQANVAERTVTIVGCGAIGSWTALQLAKMGVTKFRLIDMDLVEAVNVPTQAFGVSFVGMPKVEALKVALRREAGVEDVGTFHSEFLDTLAGPCDVLVLALDNLQARQQAYRAHQKVAGLIIDPRMGAQQLQIHSVALGEDSYRATYEKMILFPKDEDFLEEPCSARGIGYTGAIAGGIVASMVRQWFMREEGRLRVVYLDIPTMLSTTPTPWESEERLVS